MVSAWRLIDYYHGAFFRLFKVVSILQERFIFQLVGGSVLYQNSLSVNLIFLLFRCHRNNFSEYGCYLLKKNTSVK